MMRPLAALLALLTLALAACGGDDEASPSPTPSDATTAAPAVSTTPTGQEALTVQEGYARLANAISRQGQIFHTKVTTTDFGPSGLVMDIWIDPGREVARQELRYSDPSSSVADKTFIILGDSVYFGEGGQLHEPVQVCPATQSVLLSLIVDCWREQPFQEPFAFRVEPQAEYAGKAAIVLVVQSLPPSPEPSPMGQFPSIHNWLYLERDTFLPIAKLAAGHSDNGEPPDSASVSSYDNEFIPAGVLPADFFDPVSLGPVPTPP